MMAGQKRHSERPRKAALLEVFQMEKRLAHKEMILESSTLAASTSDRDVLTPRLDASLERPAGTDTWPLVVT